MNPKRNFDLTSPKTCVFDQFLWCKMRFMSHPRALRWLINLLLHHKNWSKTQVLGEVFQYSKSKFLLGFIRGRNMQWIYFFFHFDPLGGSSLVTIHVTRYVTRVDRHHFLLTWIHLTSHHKTYFRILEKFWSYYPKNNFLFWDHFWCPQKNQE